MSFFLIQIVALHDSRFSDWADSDREDGIALAAFKLEVAPPRVRFDSMILAGVSLHVLGRGFQRSFAHTPERLRQDLRVLGLAADDTRLKAAGEDASRRYAIERAG